jgi:hypothetical protein
MAPRRAWFSCALRMKKWCFLGHNVTKPPRRRDDSASSTDRSRFTGLAGLETRNE